MLHARVMAWSAKIALALVLGTTTIIGTARASVLADLAASMHPGEWKRLPANFPGGANAFWRHSENLGHDIAQFANNGVWDPARRKMTFFGSGHGTTTHKHSKLVQYDELSNTWTAWSGVSEFVPDDVANIVHSWDHLAIDPVRGHFYTAHYFNGDIHRLDLASMAWLRLPSISPVGITKGVTYFPELDALIVVDPVNRRIYSLKHGADKWTVLADNIYQTNYHPVAEYDHVRGVVYFGGGNNAPYAFYRLNPDGRVEALASPPLRIDVGNGGDMVPDPVSGRPILRMDETSQMAEYIPESNAWAMVSTAMPAEVVGTRSSFAVPISTYGVIMYVVVRDGSASAWLYKHRQGDPPSNDAPAPPTGLRLK